MKIAASVPKRSGWYWFRADENTPTPNGFVRKDVWCVVLVTPERVTRDGPPPPFIVRFPHGAYTVEQMAGQWSERLEEPEQ